LIAEGIDPVSACKGDESGQSVSHKSQAGKDVSQDLIDVKTSLQQVGWFKSHLGVGIEKICQNGV
jgi:hypothetical protein